MKENKRKSLVLVVIVAIATLILIVGAATFAFFATGRDLDNGVLNANVGTAASMYSFSAESNGNIEIDILFNEMSEAKVSTNVLKTDNATIDVKLSSPSEGMKTTCTYDIVWVWDSTGDNIYTSPDVSLTYTHTDNKVYPYEFSAKVDENEEKDLSKYPINGKTVTLQKDVTIESTSTVATEKQHRIDAYIYNLPVNQTKLFNKQFRAHLTIENLDCVMSERTESLITLTSNTTDYAESLIITGTAKNDKSNLVAYAFTTSDEEPSDKDWKAISQTDGEISQEKEVTENNMYYFWVKDAEGKAEYKSINVTNIGRKLTKTIQFYSIEDANITESSNIPNLKAIESVVITLGKDDSYVTDFYQSGDDAYVSVNAGSSNTESYSDTCSSSPFSYSALSEFICSSEDPCPNGGTCNSSTGKCTGSTYNLASNNGAGYRVTCVGAGDSTSYNNCSGDSYTACAEGYYKDASSYSSCGIATSGYGACNNPGGTIYCPSGSTCTAFACCHANCYWNGDYQAAGYYSYSCSRDTDYLNGSRCYYCMIPGEEYNNLTGACEYTCQKTRPYWYATATMTYYV